LGVIRPSHKVLGALSPTAAHVVRAGFCLSNTRES